MSSCTACNKNTNSSRSSYSRHVGLAELDCRIKEKKNAILFCDNQHAGHILQQLNTYRQEEHLCDVALQVCGKRLLAHKSVLMAASDYFKAMFSVNMAENELRDIPIVGLDSTSVGHILDYIYTGSLNVLKDDIQDLLIASDMLQVMEIKKMCVNCLMNNITLDNCVDLHEFGVTFDCSALVDRVLIYMRLMFPIVATQQSFTRLSYNVILHLVKDNELSIEPDGELCVVKAVLAWLDVDTARRTHIPELIPLLRWDSLTYECITQIQKLPSVVQSIELVTAISDWLDNGDTSTYPLPRDQRIVVVGGFLQSRTAPDSPRLCSVEVMDALNPKQIHHRLKWHTLPSLPLDATPPSFVHAVMVAGQIIVMCLTYKKKDCRTELTVKLLYHYHMMRQSWQVVEFNAESVEASNALMEAVLTCVQCKGVVLSHNAGIYTISSAGVTHTQLSYQADQLHVTQVNKLPSVPNYVRENGSVVQSMGAVVCQDHLYSIGGCVMASETERNAISDMYLWIENGERWDKMADLDKPRYGMATAVIDHLIYVSGGVDQYKLFSVEVYHANVGMWTSIRDMQTPRSYHMSLAAHGKIYVIGGQTYPRNEGRKVLNTSAMYDPSTHNWTPLRHPMLHARCMASAVIW